MATYTASSFIRAYASTDKALQIQNSFGQKIFTLNVCNYQKSFVNSYYLIITSEDGTKEYKLDFGTNTEALVAQNNLRSSVDTLIGNCSDTSVTIITSVTATGITYSQYKSLQSTSALSALTWYDISDTLNTLNLGPVIRVFAKTVDDYQPSGVVLNTGVLVTLNTVDDEIQRFELSSQKILATNNSRITYDSNCSQILAENDSTVSVVSSDNIIVSNSSVATLSGCNAVTIQNDANVTLENATNVLINGITQNLNFSVLSFNLSNVDINRNTTTGKSGKSTTNITTSQSLTKLAYNATEDQEFLFLVPSKVLDLVLDNKITQAGAEFKVKLLLDSLVNDCRINIRDKNNAVLYTASDIHNDSWLFFEFNKTTQLFEFIRVDAPEITTHKLYTTTPSLNQTIFTIPYVPNDPLKLEMFVNGVKVLYGTGFTFTSPNIVTFLEVDYRMAPTDEIEFKIY